MSATATKLSRWPRGDNYERNKAIARQRAIQRTQERETLQASITERDPCVRCGVKAQDHTALGCSSYAGSIYR